MTSFLLAGRATRGRCQNMLKRDTLACETALQLKCAIMLKSFDPETTFKQQHFLNVWALAAVQFDICK